MLLGVPTLNRYDLLARLIASAEAGRLKPSDYFIVDNGRRFDTEAPNMPGVAMALERGARFFVLTPEVNLGVAASWNALLDAAGAVPMAISNDDVELGPFALEEIEQALAAGHDFVHAGGFCLFAQTRACTEAVGLYDENFFPAYYEDSDYEHRLKTAGVVPYRATADLTHAGWSTMASNTAERDAAVKKSAEYFRAKWGGMPDDSELLLLLPRIAAVSGDAHFTSGWHRYAPKVVRLEDSPITIGVPCLFGEKDDLRRTIRSFLDPMVRVIAIDNGSSAECKLTLAEFDGRITVVRNAENVFVNPAWNQLAALFLSETLSEILVIANSDIVLSNGWAERLTHAAATAPDRFWLGRQVDADQLGGAIDATVEDASTVWAHGGSWGSFFAIRRRDVEKCFPIPDDLKLHLGDNWIFSFLVRMGVYPVIVNGLKLWHAGAVSINRLHDAERIITNDRDLWGGYLAFACKRAADAAIRGAKMDALELRYISFRDTASDINEHLPTIRAYAKQCEHITEFGFGRSSCALAHARPRVLHCYDPSPDEGRALVAEILGLARSNGIDATFHRESCLERSIDPTDMLFIDTIHTFAQLRAELSMHADSVRKYIMMHDTQTYGEIGEDGATPGLNEAIDQFLSTHHEWALEDRFKNNNGLTVLRRAASHDRQTFAELCTKYGTDKERNQYGEMYEALLAQIRDRPLRICEIGIGTLNPAATSTMVGFCDAHYKPGGGLRVFRDYCPNAVLLGLDIQHDTQFQEERITTGLCDSTDGLSVATYFASRNREFDFVVDDGRHNVEAQLATLVNFQDKVAVGGIYVIEDIGPPGCAMFYKWSSITGDRFELIHERINAIALKRVR